MFNTIYWKTHIFTKKYKGTSIITRRFVLKYFVLGSLISYVGIKFKEKYILITGHKTNDLLRDEVKNSFNEIRGKKVLLHKEIVTNLHLINDIRKEKVDNHKELVNKLNQMN